MNIYERQALIKAVNELNKMKSGDDEEWAHGEAESILFEMLKELGFGDASDAYKNARDRVGFWYA